MLANHSWLLAASTEAWSTAAARGALMLLLAAGLVKCVMILRRPTTNTVCVVALMIALFAFFASGATGFAVRFVGGSRAIGYGGTLLAMFFLLVAFLTSFIGIYQWMMAEPRYNQGIRQAISAAILAPLGLLIFAAVLIADISLPARVETLRPVASEVVEKKGEQFDELNYQYVVPNGPWKQVEIEEINDSASFGLTRSNPEIYFMIIAEVDPTGELTDSSQLAEVAKMNLKDGADAFTVQSQHSRTVNGIEGIEILTDATVDGLRLSYAHWVTVQKGFLYQLVLWSDQSNHAQLNDAVKELLPGFNLLDSTRVAETSSEHLPTHRSETYGYSVELDPQHWRIDEALQRELPGISFAAGSAGKASMIIIPIWLHGEEISSDVINAAILSRMDFGISSHEIVSIKRLPDPKLSGSAIKAKRRLDGESYDYQMRVIEREGFAYLLVAWKLSSADDWPTSRLETALSEIEFDRNVKPPVQLSFDEEVSHALFFNDAGLQLYSASEFERCAKFFKRAFEFQYNDKAMLTNVIEAYHQLGQDKEALEYLQKYATRFPNDRELLVVRGDLQLGLGDIDGVIQTYDTLFSGGYRNDDQFLGLLAVLIEHQRIDEAVERLEAYPGKDDSFDLTLVRARLHREKGEYDQAIEVLNELQAGIPFSADIAYELAEVYYEAERHQEELQTAEALLENGHNNWYVYWIKGIAEVGLERYPEAKASLELALKANPRDEDVKTLLDHVSSLLGQGDNSAIKDPIEPVVIPEQLRTAMNAPTGEVPEDVDAFYHHDITAVEFVPGESFKTTREFKVQVITRTGVDLYSTLRFDFNPLVEQMFVNELTVRDADGEVVSRGDPATYYVIDASADDMATNDQILHVPVSGLRPGCEIEFHMTRQDLASPDEFPFDEYPLALSYPIARKLLYIKAPPESFTFRSSNAGESVENDGGRYWLMNAVPFYRYEPYQPLGVEYLPTVWLGSPTATWSEVVTDYQERIEERLDPEEEVATLAASLTTEAKDETDKVLALVDYVQQHVTYRAIEFGVRGQMPQNAAKTIRDRHGDCKDHSLLLHQLLKAQGIESYLALVRSDGPIEREIPSGDQFDHMILYVPGFMEGHFFDCTNKSGDLTLAAPYGLAGRQALLIDADQPGRFETIPDYPAKAEHVDCSREIELLADGDLSIRERVVIAGYWASPVRAYLRSLTPADQETALQRILSSDGSEVQLEKHAIQGLDEPRKPMVIWSTYRVPDRFSSAGESLVGRLPHGWEHEYLSVDYLSRRFSPIEVKRASSLSAKVRLRLPSGATLDSLESWNEEANNKYAACRMRVMADKNGVLFNYQVLGRRGQYAAEDYTAFYESMKRPLAHLGQNLVVSTSGGDVPEVTQAAALEETE